MTPQHVISQLLESDTKYPNNLDLLKKIILTVYFGRLRINGLAPDNQFSLGNYLFDEEHLMFDFTHLSEEKLKAFLNWLLAAHEKDKHIDFFTDVFVEDIRGFTAEFALNWWGRLINWFKNRYVQYWKITDLNLSLNYQLTALTLCRGAQGMLIGFNQYLVPPSGAKYNNLQDPESHAAGNIKRLFITDHLVDKLKQINFKHINYESVCKNPHPQSIEVVDAQNRYHSMDEYRKSHQFAQLKPWYVRVWHWCVSLVIARKALHTQIPSPQSSILLHDSHNVKIYQREPSKEILVIEKKPALTNLVFCGGGGKIFAHIGVWQALCEANIRPINFAGSSGGAIMALLCYLGYSAQEISQLFKHYRQEHLVLFEINRNGLSDPHSVKTALDYVIAFKLQQIVSRYNIAYPQGKITFQVLESIRQLCPDCGIGRELIVTATHKRLRKTTYFSLSNTPNREVSEAVKTSASFPVVYRGTFIDDEEHIDGGVLSNFPTEVFADEHTTLLESEYGTNLQVLAIQFDNGTERNAIDTLKEVYRENFLLNWLYGVLTGVTDPASAWKMDRMKLRKHASQSIIIDVENLSSSSFTPNELVRERIISNGREATQKYLQARYSDKDEHTHESQELMYTTFNSLDDLLSYCCHRGNSQWFEVIKDLAEHIPEVSRAKFMEKAHELKQLYFTPLTSRVKMEEKVNSVTFFGNDIVEEPVAISEHNHSILLAIYPIFLKIPTDMVKGSADRKKLELAWHALSLNTPFRCVEYFNEISPHKHIILQIFINFVKELKDNPCDSIFAALNELQLLLYREVDLIKPELYGCWDLSFRQSVRVLKLFTNNQQQTALQLLYLLANKEEPMGVVRNGVFASNICDEEIETSRMAM